MKKYIAVIAAVSTFFAVLLSGCAEENIPKPYEELINKAREAIESEDPETIVKDGLFDPTGIIELKAERTESEALSTIGCTICDIDGNGTDELIIADAGSAAESDRILLAYTLDGDKPVLLMSGWARNRYYLLDDGTIYNEASGGAASTAFEINRISSDGLSLELIDCYYSALAGEKQVWYHNQTGKMTEDESELIADIDGKTPVQAMEDYMAKAKKLDLKFFK